MKTTKQDIIDLAQLLQRIESRPGFAGLSAQVRQAILTAAAIVALSNETTDDGQGSV